MIDQLVGYNVHRALVGRQSDDTSTLQLCLTDCLTTAVYDTIANCDL